MISPLHLRVAARFLEAEAWKYVGDMNRPRALELLGFSPNANPSTEEIKKSYKAAVLKSHSDVGGSHERSVELNLAKDFLLGEGSYARRRPVPESPPKPKTRAEPIVERVHKGKPFHEGVHVPGGVEWLFASKGEYVPLKGPEDRSIPGTAWVVVGKKENEIFVLGLRRRREDFFYTDLDRSGKVVFEEDWASNHVVIPAGKDPVKAIPKAMADVFRFADGEASVPKRYIAWPGGALDIKTINWIGTGGGGASFKDVMLATGVASVEHKDLAGRKINVEIKPLYNRDKAKILREERERAGRKIYTWEAFDYIVSVNGKPTQLSDETIRMLEKNHFLMAVFSYDMRDGVSKNLTKMRGGGRLSIHGGYAIKLLIDSLTSEHALKAELERALAADWPDVKTASYSYDRS